MMADRITGRHSAVIARKLHPEYREVINTYATHQAIPLKTVSFTDSGQIDLKELEKAVGDDTACLLIHSPNFFGTIEDVDTIAEIDANIRSLLCGSVAPSASLVMV